MNKLLEKLVLSDSLYELSLTTSNITILKNSLNHSEEIFEIREAFLSGSIIDDDIKEFVEYSMANLKLGERIPEDLALAVLSIVLEPYVTEFAEEYIHDLSRLKLSEMPLSIAIAKLSYKIRSALTKDNSTIKIINITPFVLKDSPKEGISEIPSWPENHYSEKKYA